MEGLKAALETTKQIITLSTGVIALTITFLEKVVQPTAATARQFHFTLKLAWIAFGIAIVFAVWTLLALTGTMNALDRKARGLALSGAQSAATTALLDGLNIRVPTVVMLAFFVIGTLLTIVTGFFL